MFQLFFWKVNFVALSEDACTWLQLRAIHGQVRHGTSMLYGDVGIACFLTFCCSAIPTSPYIFTLVIYLHCESFSFIMSYPAMFLGLRFCMHFSNIRSTFKRYGEGFDSQYINSHTCCSKGYNGACYFPYTKQRYLHYQQYQHFLNYMYTNRQYYRSYTCYTSFTSNTSFTFTNDTCML